VIARRGKPGLIVSDQDEMGPWPRWGRVSPSNEFSSNAMLASTEEIGVSRPFIAPGKPMQNGICEAFNSKMRDELLNEPLFHGLDHAGAIVADWGADYNAERPHPALGAPPPRSRPNSPQWSQQRHTQPRASASAG
jgi:putative transposase